MATIRKRGDLQWQAIVRRKGYPDVSRTFNTKADAQAWATDTEATMRKGLWLDRTEAEQTTLDTLLDRYKREITPQKRGYAQEQSKINVLKKSPLASLMVAGITGASVALYRDERLKTVSPQTVIHELHLLRHVFEISIKEWGLPLVSNPVALVSLPKLPRARDRRLVVGEEDRLLEAALKYGGCIRPAIIIALETGMRRGEIASLEWKDIDLKCCVTHLQQTKNGEHRDVPLSTRALATLKAMPRRIDGQVFGIRSDGIGLAFRRVCARTKSADGTKDEPIVDLRFHDLRHEATSRLFEKGLNPMQVAAITGHKTLQMLKRYTHLRAEDLAKMLG